MAKFKSRYEVDEFAIPNLVIKVKPYIYGDKRSLADPECNVRTHVDIWVTTGRWKFSPSSKPEMEFFARARVDFEEGAFYVGKTGKRITVDNARDTIDAIQRAMEKAEEEENDAQ